MERLALWALCSLSLQHRTVSGTLTVSAVDQPEENQTSLPASKQEAKKPLSPTEILVSQNFLVEISSNTSFQPMGLLLQIQTKTWIPWSSVLVILHRWCSQEQHGFIYTYCWQMVCYFNIYSSDSDPRTFTHLWQHLDLEKNPIIANSR